VNPRSAAIAGGMAGCVGKTVTAPLSRLTILLQVAPMLQGSSGSAAGSIRASNGLIASFSTILRKEGFLSFWKGNMTSVVHRFPYSAINFTVYEKMRAVLRGMTPDGVETPALRLVAGALGGGVATAMVYPLDLMRARLSVQSGNQYNGLLGGTKKVVGEEGVLGMYKGLGASLLVAVPNMALGYCVYGTAKEFLMGSQFHGAFTDKESDKLTAKGAVLSGAMSGLLSSGLTFPVDLLRRRLQVHGAFEGGRDVGPGTIRGTFGTILSTSGVRGFYSGISSELVKVIPMCAVTFSVYELCLRVLEKPGGHGGW